MKSCAKKKKKTFKVLWVKKLFVPVPSPPSKNFKMTPKHHLQKVSPMHEQKNSPILPFRPRVPACTIFLPAAKPTGHRTVRVVVVVVFFNLFYLNILSMPQVFEQSLFLFPKQRKAERRFTPSHALAFRHEIASSNSRRLRNSSGNNAKVEMSRRSVSISSFNSIFIAICLNNLLFGRPKSTRSFG